MFRIVLFMLTAAMAVDVYAAEKPRLSPFRHLLPILERPREARREKAGWYPYKHVTRMESVHLEFPTSPVVEKDEEGWVQVYLEEASGIYSLEYAQEIEPFEQEVLLDAFVDAFAELADLDDVELLSLSVFREGKNRVIDLTFRDLTINPDQIVRSKVIITRHNAYFLSTLGVSLNRHNRFASSFAAKPTQ